MELVASAVGTPSTNTAGAYMPATFAPPLNPKTGAMRHRLPDEGAAILRCFATTHGRGPTSSESRELVAQIQRETGYETNCNSVKFWFFRRRLQFNLKPLASLQSSSDMKRSGKRTIRPSWKVSHIAEGSVTISTSTTSVGGRSRLLAGPLGHIKSHRNGSTRRAVTSPCVKSKVGGNRRRYPQECVAIFEEFALCNGRYPTAGEARDLIKRVWEDTGYQTTVKSVKYWFYQHRTEYNLKPLVDPSRALHFQGFTALQIGRKSSTRASGECLAVTIPPRPSALTKLSATRSASTAAQSCLTLPPVIDPTLPSLSEAHVAILKALQPSGDQMVGDSVVSACAESWRVDKGLIEDWLRSNRVSSPLTPLSLLAFTPISFSNPLSPDQGHEGSPSPQFVWPLTVRPSPSGDASQERVCEVFESAPFDAVAREGSLHSAEMESAVDSGNMPRTLATEQVANPVVKAIVEAVRDSIGHPLPPTKKPSNATDFKALWPPVTCMMFGKLPACIYSPLAS